MPDDIQDIRNNKIKELEQQQKIAQQINQLESLAKQYMTKEAIERYSNLKVAHQELAINVISLIAKAVKTNQLKQKITDQQFKDILVEINPNKERFRIIK